ncbi:acyltransferase family protein [Steroidobacter sp.]|uniref:acyltransferase family protein n=1 Tax=Steroidobacter sp. TaxID=1978227 RepID=UPI001A6298C3|nr:acyltransferase [Steroidobacter sp.]MBL8267818.1 acyltransferase [Steroidobacter sp.]
MMIRDLSALTAMRYFAALGVVLYHYGRQLDVAPWLKHAIANGFMGMPFFFILSGFVLVYASQGRTIGVRDFLARRFARLYPVYAFAWALTGITKIAVATSGAQLAKTTVVFGGSSLLLVQAWIPGAAKHWNWPAWSLSCEVFFYAMFPFVYLSLSRLSTRMLAVLAGVLTALSALKFYVVAMYAKTTIFRGTLLHTSMGEYLDQLPVLAIIVFLLGATLGHLYVRGVRVPTSFALPTAVAIAALFVSNGTVLGLPPSAWLPPLFCVMILALADMTYELPPFALLLGNASYSMYILQFPLHDLLYPTVAQPTILGLIGFMVLLTACSIATFLYIEQPAARWIKRGVIRRPLQTSVQPG